MRQDTRLALLALLALSVLPFRADGGPCFDVTTSLASTIRNPSNGDEHFFTLPVGPANIMFILDTSGSMKALPQCGDETDWGGSEPACSWPTWPAHAQSGADVVGTCDVAANPSLAWMQTYTPDPAVLQFDPGHPTNSLGLTDAPSWGSTCTGNNCLFSPTAIYQHYNWGETSAPQFPDCSFRNPSGTLKVDGTKPYPAVNATACSTCLASKGFYFAQARLSNGTLDNQLLLSGAWLNANPPKFMAARKVIKDLVWMDPSNPSKLDAVRFGLSILHNSNRAGQTTIVVPLGPDKSRSFPSLPANFVQARQYMIDALNRNVSGIALPSYMSGNTPLATTLFRVGQYLTSPGAYTAAFGSTFESSLFLQSSAGLVNAPWARNNPNQCSICWGCQHSSIILVTDGSPNSELTLPAAINSYDSATYTNNVNCGLGNTCGSSTPTNHVGTNANATNVIGTGCTGGKGAKQTCNCPDGSKTLGTDVCWSLCPGDSIHYPEDYVCWSTCPGDPTHHPANYVCYVTCGTDPTNYPPGYSCSSSLCCSPSGSSTTPSPLPRVASWLRGNDLRADLSVSDPQTVSTYTISFGLTVPPPPAVNNAVQILEATAHMGGGLFKNASDARTLVDAVAYAVNDLVARFNAFSAPAAASLSTLRTIASEAVLTRFKPNDTPVWEGHVFQGMLFDEFANGCDPTKPPGPGSQPQVACGGKPVNANFNGDADANGNALCNGVFLVDADCDEVTENPATGEFLKKGTGGAKANFFWDAGFALSNPTYPPGTAKADQPVPGYLAANDRNILSAVNGVVTPFDAAHAATYAPLMNLDSTWCASKLQLWGICGTAPLPSCTSVASQCARAIIDFVHGWDVTDIDGDGCGVPGRFGNSTKCKDGADGEERNRANDSRSADPTMWKLGDVFHSAPVLVRPPLDEIVCGLGFENQCTATIFSPSAFPQQTDNPPAYTGLGGKAVDAYERWRLDHVDRPQVVLVGSNDGMLHAFDAGTADPLQPRNPFGEVPYTKGTGQELWAFIPPDLLPRLKDLTQAHQYMVDGSVMVKDVWVDGSKPIIAEPIDKALGAVDNRKDLGEFHTLAVITERAGGTQYTALDVTDVLKPKYLWSFPPPGSDDARYMAQSWSDFAPGPPPIGPVRLALRAGEPDTTKPRGFEERWIVAVNGGYDPTLARGRAMWMLDVWTGQVIWRFTDDDFKALMGYGHEASMFPVTGALMAVDIGDPTQPTPDRDGFFDTATWGDLGGNLFVARFWEKGLPDAVTGRVTNWFAARTFEQRRRSDNAMVAQGREPFFFFTENVFDSSTGTLRSFLGGGNRERSMALGAECNPDNLLGCCAAGCTSIDAVVTDDFGTCRQSAEFKCLNGQLLLEPTSSTCGPQVAACGGFTGTAALSLTCPTGSINVTAKVVCDASGICQQPPLPAGTYSANLGIASVGSLPAATTKPRFYGVWSFGGTPAKMFGARAGDTIADTRTQAKAFEGNRFTDVDYPPVCTGPAGGSCSLVNVTGASVSYNPGSPLQTSVVCSGPGACEASSADAGWFYQLGDSCPLGPACDPPPPWFDEKTGAGATVLLGCTSWTGFRPIGAQSGSDPCGGSVGTPQAYAYRADYMTGVPTATCGSQYAATTGYVRATKRDTVSTPNAQTIRVVMSPSGQVKYQGLEFPPGGGGSGAVATTDYGTRADTAETMYWLEVPRDLHDCRHNPTTATSSCQ